MFRPSNVDPRQALTYATQRHNGKVLVLRTDLRSRVFIMAGMINDMLAKGYRNDMVDWYTVTMLLQLDKTAVPAIGSAVTCFRDFQLLYAWADQSNVRSINCCPIDSDDIAVSLVIRDNSKKIANSNVG